MEKISTNNHYKRTTLTKGLANNICPNIITYDKNGNIKGQRLRI